MIISTKELKQMAGKLAVAMELDKKAPIELTCTDQSLYMSIATPEIYLSVKAQVEQASEFKVLVDGSLLLSLINSFSVDTISMDLIANAISVKAGKSNYKLAFVYNAGNTTPIMLAKPEVELKVARSILSDILTVNRKEFLKNKIMTAGHEVQKMYYVDEEGCFTFMSGACLNQFHLEKPVKLLLNDTLVKLFKIFTEETIDFKYGKEMLESGFTVSKVVLMEPKTYLGAFITADDTLFTVVQNPYRRAKELAQREYRLNFQIDSAATLAAISRLANYTKATSTSEDSTSLIPIDMVIDNSVIKFEDAFGNSETVDLESALSLPVPFTIHINLIDLKYVLESYKNEQLTICCEENMPILIKHNNITNMILPRS